MDNKFNMSFDKLNLCKDEEALFAFKPCKTRFRNTFFGKIPFPVTLVWAILGFSLISVLSILFGFWLLILLLPFVIIAGLPILVYLYTLISGLIEYYVCEHIITTERFITIKSQKILLNEYEIADIKSMKIVAKKNISSLHINAADKRELKLYSLTDNIKKTIKIFNNLKKAEKLKNRNDEYKITCYLCGGRTKNGYCVYCGSEAELKETIIAPKTTAATKIRKRLKNI